MPTTGIENLPPELLQMIANYLPPSDVLQLSLATKKASFLMPDYDQMLVNKNGMVRGYYRTTLLNTEFCADVNEVMVSVKRKTGTVCSNFHFPNTVVFKRNLIVSGDITTFDLLPAKRLKTDKVSTLRGSIAEKGDTLKVEVYEDHCCKVTEATIFVFYTNKRNASAIARQVNPLNIIPSHRKRNR